MNQTIAYKKVDSEKKTGKLELVESFRAISALFIILFHATELFQIKFNRELLFGIFKFGDSGVDFFFVLSGFVLFFSQSKYIGNHSQFKNFIFKRFIRIYPIYWVINLFVVPIYFLMPSLGKGYETSLSVIIKSLLLVPQEPSPILAVAWFLSHIVFFYLLFGLLIAFELKFTIPVICIWITGTIVFLITGNMPQEGLSLGFLLSPYNLEFLGGCGVAYWVGKYSLNKKYSLIILITGIISFLLCGVVEDYFILSAENSWININYYEIFAYGISSMLIVLGAASIDNHVNNHLKINPILLNLASASYAIYLSHYPILSILTKGITLIGITSYGIQSIAMLIFCIISVLIGYAIHLYIENKLINFLAKLRIAS